MDIESAENQITDEMIVFDNQDKIDGKENRTFLDQLKNNQA